MNTTITPATAEAIRARHDALRMRRDVQRARGVDLSPACLDLPKGYGRVRWVNGSVTETDLPLAILAKWSRTFDAGAAIAVTIDPDEGRLTATHGDAMMALLFAKTSDDPRPATEPIVEVNLDGPVAVVVEGSTDATPMDTATLRRELAAGRHAVQQQRIADKARKRVGEALSALRQLRSEYQTARAALTAPGAREACLVRVKVERASRAYLREFHRLATDKSKNPWSDNNVFAPRDLGAWVSHCMNGDVRCTDAEFEEVCRLVLVRNGIPEKHCAKRYDALIALGRACCGIVNRTHPDLHVDLIRRRKSDPYMVHGYVQCEQDAYRMARRFMRGYAERKRNALETLRIAVEWRKLNVKEG